MHIAIYARVSTGRQAENELSIPDQLRQIRQWAERNGHVVAREYVEPGASATDDKRPVFQNMMLDAAQKPAPFQLIAVHSFSRFFRDHIEGAIYQRRLRKYGVKVESITQQTSEDPSGEMHRSMIMLFDEYQSKENAKHTLRGMQENARQGYYNGARAPYGYMTVDAGQTGARGRMKKKLAIEPAEAEIVREIFNLYIGNVKDAPRIGMKDIAKRLNERGVSMRGKPWRAQKIYNILSSSTYAGQHVFNKENSKTRQIKDKSEWVTMEVPAIVSREHFGMAARFRAVLTPMKSAPRRETSPNLLTGLLKCDCCGSTMVAVTSGKGESYRYYKCASRMSKGNTACASRAVPMDKIDALIIEAFRQTIYTPSYIRGVLDDLRRLTSQHGGEDKRRLKQLEAELKDTEQAEAKLFEAIEKGVLELDDRLKARVQQHKARREKIAEELAVLQRAQPVSFQVPPPQRIEAVARVMNRRFSSSTPFSRAYIKATVNEIRVTGDMLKLTGEHRQMATLIAAGGHLDPAAQVRRFISVWRPLIDAVRTDFRQDVMSLHDLMPPKFGWAVGVRACS